MEKLYTLAEAAKKAPVQAVTLRKYCLAGKIGRKMGRDWFVTEADLAAVRGISVKERRGGRPRKAKKGGKS